MSDITSDTGRIERDLDETRSRLGSHLNELQDRLSPGQVVDDLMSYFRGSEGAVVGRSLLESVRSNPMPVAITTIGLAWLMASNPRATSGNPGRPSSSLPVYGHDDHAAAMDRLSAVRQAVTRQADEPEHDYSLRLDQAHGEAMGLAKHPDETTESFGQRIRQAMGGIEDAVTRKAHDLRDQAGVAVKSAGSAIGTFGASAQGAARDAASSAGSAISAGSKSVSQAGGNLIGNLTESPVLLGALGLAVGALLGALLPQSDQEEAALGGIAARTKDAVANLANDGLEKGGRVMQAVADSARGSAQDQGLSEKSAGQLVDAALSGELAGTVKQVAGDVLHAGEGAIRKEALDQTSTADTKDRPQHSEADLQHTADDQNTGNHKRPGTLAEGSADRFGGTRKGAENVEPEIKPDQS